MIELECFDFTALQRPISEQVSCAIKYRDKYLFFLFLLVKSFYEGFKFLLDLTNFL